MLACLQNEWRVKHESLVDAHAKMKTRAKSLLGDLNQARQTIDRLEEAQGHAVQTQARLSETEVELQAARSALERQSPEVVEHRERGFDLAAIQAARKADDGSHLSEAGSERLAELESLLLSDVPRDEQMGILRRLQNADVEGRLALMVEALALIPKPGAVSIDVRVPVHVTCFGLTGRLQDDDTALRLRLEERETDIKQVWQCSQAPVTSLSATSSSATSLSATPLSATLTNTLVKNALPVVAHDALQLEDELALRTRQLMDTTPETDLGQAVHSVQAPLLRYVLHACLSPDWVACDVFLTLFLRVLTRWMQRSMEDRVAELEGEHMQHLQQQEYVRNVVFKYMLGAHQEELARVITTVLEFEPKQKQQVST